MADQPRAITTLPDGTQIERAEPMINARTSTKVAGTGLMLGLPIIQGIQAIDFPWPWVEQFTNSALFVQLATLLLAYVTARISKSPLAGTLL